MAFYGSIYIAFLGCSESFLKSSFYGIFQWCYFCGTSTALFLHFSRVGYLDFICTSLFLERLYSEFLRRFLRRYFDDVPELAYGKTYFCEVISTAFVNEVMARAYFSWVIYLAFYRLL